MTTGTVTVRPAVPSEFPEVARVAVAAYRTSGMIPEGSGYDARLADAASRAAGGELLVAVAVDRVVGTVTFCPYGSPFAEISRPGEAEFRMLAVAPEARGNGVGEALVRAVVDRARRSGARALVLSTPDIAHGARRLYARMGFTRLPERDWSPVPGVSLLAYRMEL